MTDARCVLVAYVFTKEEEDTPKDGGEEEVPMNLR